MITPNLIVTDKAVPLKIDQVDINLIQLITYWISTMTQVILHVDDLALHLNKIIPDGDHFILVSTNPVDIIPVAIQSILMFRQLLIILHIALFVVVGHEPQSCLHLFYLSDQEIVVYLCHA